MASLIHKGSCEGINEELDLFSVSPNQTSLDKGSYVEYHPVSTLSSASSIEFVVSRKISSYIDLSNTSLHVHTRIKKQDGTVFFIPDSNVASVCNFLHALWSQSEVYIVSGAGFKNQNYPIFSSDSDCKFLNFRIWIRIRILIL